MRWFAILFGIWLLAVLPAPAIAAVDGFAELVARAGPTVVFLGVPDGAGSGFFFTTDGLIGTCEHVIAGGGPIRVVTADGTEYRAEVLAADPELDLAILKVKPGDGSTRFPCLELAGYGESRAGDWAIAAGCPNGWEFRNSFSVGIISGLGRFGQGKIQTDASINPGNSGGPLLNVAGKVVGINSSVLRGDCEGMGFAIPAYFLAKLYRREVLHEPEGWLGAEMVGDDTPMVLAVAQGSPAERAGFRRGDEILEIGGRRIGSGYQFILETRNSTPGERKRVEYRRGGTRTGCEVEVLAMPATPAQAARYSEYPLGLMVVDGLAMARVERVLEGGAAQLAGIRAGDALRAIDNEMVGSAADFAVLAGKIRSGAVARVTIYRNRRNIDFQVNR